MYKEIMRSISDVESFPVIAIVVFFIFFVGLLVRVFTMRKKHLDHMASLPLEEDQPNHLKKVWAILLLGLVPTLSKAQSSETGVSQDALINLLIFTMVIIAFVCLLLTITIIFLIQQSKAQEVAETETGKAAVVAGLPPLFSWKSIMKRLTHATPIEQEADIDLGHDYDGIRELDNALPPWWKWGFYITIGFAGFYLWYYHIYTDWSSSSEYDEAMVVAAAEKEAFLAQSAAQVDETNVTVLTDDATLMEGKNIYTTNCVACHGPEGQGGVGPNFADEYWIHGGSVKDIFSTIKYGVIEKGMIPWQDQLRPQEMQAVTSYILTFQGTNPPNPKDPQGELYVPEADSAVVPLDTTVTLSLR